MITHSFDLNIVPGGVKVVRRLNQYDSDFSLQIHLVSSYGEFSIEDGTTAQIRGTKPDGNGYSAEAAVDTETNIVTVTGDVQITAASGRGVFEICLMKDNRELNTANFALEIERAPLDRDSITSESVIRELIGIADEVDEIVDLARDSMDGAGNAEAWAVGQRNGVDVPSTDETYRNNAKHYAQQAADTFDSLGLSVVDGALCYTYTTE